MVGGRKGNNGVQLRDHTRELVYDRKIFSFVLLEIMLAWIFVETMILVAFHGCVITSLYFTEPPKMISRNGIYSYI